MLRMCRRFLLFALPLLLLVGCGTAVQTPQTTYVAASTPSTPTPTVTPDSSGISLAVPALPTPTATPTSVPTARPTSPPTSSPPPPSSGLTGQLEQQLFALINQERAAEGLSAYVLNGTLSAGARQHSVRMATSGCGLSHQCSGEPSPCQRVTNEGITWTSCGENVAYSSPNPTAWAGVQGVEQDMLNEQPPDDGHRLNLLSTSYHRVGVGIYIDAKGLVWITEDFAS